MEKIERGLRRILENVMLTRRMFKDLPLVLLVALVSSVAAPAQQQQGQGEEPQRGAEQGRNTGFVEQPLVPDFARENLSKVAASATQIREVLVKDAGMMVELKRWVAKEATDNGQIVDDNSLSDDAIFERLEHDLSFRAVATRLVQRYGYLLPNVNPDSEMGKEQELLLKQRLHRLEVQEDQEAAEAAKIGNAQNQNQQTQRAKCDGQDQQDCYQASPQNRRNLREQQQEETPYSQPNLPLLPEEPPSSNLSPLLRAGQNFGQSDSQNYPGSDLGLGLALTSNSSRNPQDLFQGLPGYSQPGSMDDLASLLRSNNSDNLPFMPSASSDSRNGSYMGMNRERNSRARRGSEDESEAEAAETEKDLTPVAMVHKRNPYSDIPSLYDMYVQASSQDREPKRFGLAVFRNENSDSDLIPMDLPVGPDYVVGPGDSLAIDLWGGVSQRITRVVDREGRIALPEAGPLLVSGHSLGEVQQAVQQALRTEFREVSADVSLSRLRTIRVYIVGEVVDPGAYDISSLSTPLNALFAAGGVTARGSLRKLQHYRGRQLLEEVDAYDLLLRGVGGNLQRLENGDSLLVPSVGAQVTVTGMVRRPAVYELNGESSLADALDLAGGILPAAALQHIEVQRLEAHEKRTMLNINISRDSDSDVIAKQLSAFKIQDGDQIHVFPIAPYNESAIYLQGHVLRPGRYSYHEGMKLSDVVASYADLLPEPAGRYAEIIRLNPPDYRPSVESFDLTAAMKDPGAAPKLQPLDTIRIFSRFDFEQPPFVWVGGEVHTPGTYRTSGQAHLRDAVYLAGGILPDASLLSAQLFRTNADGTMKIFSVNLGEALAGNPVDNLALEPRDRLLVHRNPAQVDPPTVYVKGEVAKPGRYPLTGNMRVEDLVLVAGGLKRSADTNLADLTSHSDGDPAHPTTQTLDVKLSAAMEGDASADVPLRDGDVLTIRQSPGWNDLGAMVTLKGEVQNPGTFGIHPGERLSSVIERAGGFDPQAYPYGAVLMRRDVRNLEMKSHDELLQRVKAEQVALKALPEGDEDQKNAKLTAIAQTETALTDLEENAPIGRVVIHIRTNLKEWRNTNADVPMQDGDVLVIPKKADYVTVTGQVFNATAISYQPGRSAKWYLGQAGGLTPLAEKNGVFVIRADGSVVAAKNVNTGWFSGDPLTAVLRPGDSIVVPEKSPKIGGRNWQNLMQSAQVASAVALAVAYIHP
jgi:protein involved in polysaccharide export with SLBB domain